MDAPRHDTTIPLIDLGRLENSGAKERADFLAELRHAARQVRFFYISRHRVFSRSPSVTSWRWRCCSRRIFAAIRGGAATAGWNPCARQLPAGRERIAAAFFLGARLDASVPLLALPPELAAQARGPERDPNNPLFRDVGQNYLKGRLRSHPDVAQRHYADLVDADASAVPASGD